MPVQHRPVQRAQHLCGYQADPARPELPKVGGLEILQKCKVDPRTKNIPVVVLTSSREERDLIQSYHLGVNSYVVKPVDFPQFTDAVRQLGLYWMLLNQVPSEPLTEPEPR